MCWSRDGAFFDRLNEALHAMHARGQLHLVSNNKADAAYLHAGCGLHTPVLPSLCTYTRATYTGRRREWVLIGTDEVPVSARGQLITLRAAFGDGCFGEGRKYDFAQLFDMAGVVLLPCAPPPPRTPPSPSDVDRVSRSWHPAVRRSGARAHNEHTVPSFAVVAACASQTRSRP
jgi:hypothetical protein